MRTRACLLRVYRGCDALLRAYHLEASRDGYSWVRLSSHWTMAGLERFVRRYS